MKCEICGALATIHVCELDGSGGSTNRSFCAAHAQEHLDFPIPSEAGPTQWQDDFIPPEINHRSMARLLELMIDEAFELGIPRIEIEVSETGADVRYEIDGNLVERDFLMPHLYAALLDRVKQLEKLDAIELGNGRRVAIEYRSDGGVTLRPISSQ